MVRKLESLIFDTVKFYKYSLNSIFCNDKPLIPLKGNMLVGYKFHTYFIRDTSKKITDLDFLLKLSLSKSKFSDPKKKIKEVKKDIWEEYSKMSSSPKKKSFDDDDDDDDEYNFNFSESESESESESDNISESENKNEIVLIRDDYKEKKNESECDVDDIITEGKNKIESFPENAYSISKGEVLDNLVEKPNNEFLDSFETIKARFLLSASLCSKISHFIILENQNLSGKNVSNFETKNGKINDKEKRKYLDNIISLISECFSKLLNSEKVDKKDEIDNLRKLLNNQIFKDFLFLSILYHSKPADIRNFGLENTSFDFSEERYNFFKKKLTEANDINYFRKYFLKNNIIKSKEKNKKRKLELGDRSNKKQKIKNKNK